MPSPTRITGVYEPHQVEKWVKDFWRKNNIYSKVKALRNNSDKVFNFLDGPPYPSSSVPHAGTAWNRVLKDSILRFWRMKGYKVLDTPGYDCHGLPIEVAVERKLGVKIKKEIEEKIGVEKFIEECKKFAITNINGLTYWFKELGVFMDWDHPYLTMDDKYIEAAWWLIKRAHEKGMLEQEHRVVYWCPRCETTLAEYEVEYHELEDPSIYVKFPVKGEENTFLLIWTTTPWTLPANTFVMAHPDAIYVKVRVAGDILILAKARLRHVMEEAGVKDYEILGEMRGEELDGVEYINPLEALVPLQKKLAKYHRVVLSREHVSLYEGTGLVHSAPGHGFEDFEEAKRVGVDFIASPLRDDGSFTEEAGKYFGKKAREANKEIINDLRKLGALFYETSIRHRYPVCWRCKTPVLLRATMQWVLKVTRVKEKLKEEARKPTWIPKWAYDRLNSMLTGLQDWVLSRQRYWGIPLPIWVCRKCGYRIVLGSKKDIKELGGKEPKELHRPWVDSIVLKCPKCGGEMRRVPDVVDVWFDSGVAFYASRFHPRENMLALTEKRYKVDFITEGHDQTRGWFFSLLRAGVIGFEEAPYNTVLVHGFMLDEQGREMHKSLGNYVAADEIIMKAGADVFRFWVLQNTIWEDARFSWKKLEEERGYLNIVWNVFVFASTYMELDKFDPLVHTLDKYAEILKVEDKWVLSRLAKLVRLVTSKFEEYRIHEAARALKKFIIEDVSHWYIRLIRRRVWIEESSDDKYAAYATLYTVLKTWLLLAAPIIPFIAEKLYQDFIRRAEPELPESIHMMNWPQARVEFIDENVEKEMEVLKRLGESVASLRMKAGIKMRQPLRRIIVFTDSREVKSIIKKNENLVSQISNAKIVEVKEPKEEKEYLGYRVEPVYSAIGPEFRKTARAVIDYIEKHGDKIARDIIEKGEHRAVINGREITLTEKHVRIVPFYRAGFYAQPLEWGVVLIDTTLTEEEIAEGFARDLVRRIQFMRKKMGLDVEDRIIVYLAVPSGYAKYVEMYKEFISNEVRAEEIALVDSERVKEFSDYSSEWSVSDVTVTIGLKRLSGG